jgi:hypothetical protein
MEVFLRGSCRGVIRKTMGQISRFSTGVCEERNWAHEAEESPLLEAVARGRLVKIQEAGKRLADAVVIYEFWD